MGASVANPCKFFVLLVQILLGLDNRTNHNDKIMRIVIILAQKKPIAKNTFPILSTFAPTLRERFQRMRLCVTPIPHKSASLSDRLANLGKF